MIQAAYPGLDEADIDELVEAAEEQEPPVQPQPVAALPASEDAEPEAPSETEPEEPEDEGERAMFTIDMTHIERPYQEVISDVAERMSKRLAIATRKAAKKPAEFLEWLDDELPSHIPVIADALQPVVKAWRALGHDGWPADEIAATWLEQWAASLLDHSGRCTAETMPAYMDGVLAELEKSLKQSLVTMIGE